MLSNRLAFAALAIACLGAAAGGGYLATRQNVVPSPASAQGQPLPGDLDRTRLAIDRRTAAVLGSACTSIAGRSGNRGRGG